MTLTDCAGCGRPWDPADMLEAHLPARVVAGDEHFGVAFTLSTLALVGPCCAELADPEEGGEAIETP